MEPMGRVLFSGLGFRCCEGQQAGSPIDPTVESIPDMTHTHTCNRLLKRPLQNAVNLIPRYKP